MYEQIFDDFNAIKQHCERNGDIAFEESLVFELLEKYFPKYGSQKAIQKVLDMLDVQRIRERFSEDFIMENIVDTEATVRVKDETKNVDESSIDAYNSESNDADSIIEVEVPKKVFPFIDLTDNSPESDVIIEKATPVIGTESDNSLLNDSDDNISDNYDQNLSDPDIVRHVNNDYIWRNTNEDSRSHDPPMLDVLADFNGTDKSNNDVFYDAPSIDVPEILEENNNDPNNNLEVYEEPINANNVIIDNSIQELEIIKAVPNSNKSVIEIDSIPGCSKDTDRDVINRIYKKARNNLPNIHSPMSSVAGCSKDFQMMNSSDDSDSDETFHNDESIQNDIMCIQEIIPWAETQVILKLLKRNYMEDKRKEITLWKLMEKQTNKNSKKMKRKHNKSSCHTVESSRKKSKNFDYIDHSSVEMISSESSNDIVSSKEQITHEMNFKTSSIDQNHQDAVMSLKNIDKKNETVTKTSDSNVSPSKKIIKEATQFFQMNIESSTLTLNDHLETKKSKPIKFPAKIPLFIPRSLNSNNVNNDMCELHEFDSFNDIIPIDRTEQDLLTISLNIPLFNSEPHNPLTFQSQPGGSKSKMDKNATIVRPSRLNLSPSPVVIETKVPRMQPMIHPAKLNNIGGLYYTMPENNLLPKTKAKSLPNVPQNISKKDLVGTMRRNPLYTCASYPKNKEEFKGVRVPDQKLIKEPVIKDYYPVPIGTLHTSNQNKFTLSTPTGLFNTQIRATATSTVTTPLHSTLRSRSPSRLPHSPHNDMQQILDHIIRLDRPSTNINIAADVQPSTSSTSNGINIIEKPVEVPYSVYVKLRSMFPEVQKNYIKKICKNPPIPLGIINEGVIFNLLIDHLLREGSNNLEVQNMQNLIPENAVSSQTVDEKYECLVGIFPNADPTYLREFVEKETTTDQAIKDFIEQKIETHDYPTKQDYLKKIKITEQIRQYTTNFNVENFLKLFPDPIKHFEDSGRQNSYQLIAIEFLKSHFNRYKVCTINKMYKLNKYNLSITSKLLSSMSPDMKSKRGSSEMPTENIPLLQEIAFVRNKKKILDHIDRMKKQEEEEFNELKKKGLLLTCLCCYNDECMPTKSSECNAGHVFCYECIVRGTETALADGNAHVRCFTDCQSDFSLATLQKVLQPTQFSSLLVKRQAAEVAAAAVEGLVSCPFCYFASIPPPEDKVFKCLNPDCMKESCRLCKELNHVPLRCDEVIKTDKARLMIEEKMTEALLRTCYQCKKQFYKEEGCNKMRCQCGALMCYVCDKPVKGYDHFNAQGGANSALCPLWSDDRRLNAESVRKVAEEVKNSILKQNPNLKIDTESLLPRLPPKSRGPHDDIPNANQIHEHVRRVANAP